MSKVIDECLELRLQEYEFTNPELESGRNPARDFAGAMSCAAMTGYPEPVHTGTTLNSNKAVH